MILQNWWFTTLLGETAPMCTPLEKHINADVLIVGGGAAGLSAAARLMNSGRRVVLLEKNICGGSSTGKSAGLLTPDSELELSQLIRRFGIECARDLWDIPLQGISIIKDLVEKYNIQCDFIKQDSLFLGNGGTGLKNVLDEVAARKSLGLKQEFYDAQNVQAILGTTAYTGGVRYTDTYVINALRYAHGIKRVLIDNGVEIYEASEVRALNGHTAQTHLGSVTAESIILCADKIGPAISPYARNIFHIQTFLSITEPLQSNEIAKLFPDGNLQCWDSDLIYNYFRLTGDHRLLLGGGSMLSTYSNKSITSPMVINRVIRRFIRRFPSLRNINFIQYWPGNIDTTCDLIPTVGSDPDSPWIHFVLGCAGLPWATFCGDFVARHVLDDTSQDQHYDRYFNPKRDFLVPLGLESVLGKPLTFSINNLWSKYYQVEKKQS
jgi:gamma-glutamylputrescine oxidase